MLNGFEKALLGVLVLVLMAGMGATLDMRQFRDVLRKPKGVLIGVASQFGFMPLVALCLAKALRLPGEFAVGLILIGCMPGGTTSNLFSYYARADVALSVSMTAASTLLSIFALPLLLLFYATPLTPIDLTIPYGNIVQTLVVVLLPVAVGMAVRAKSLRAARMLERVGSLAGIVTLLLLIVASMTRNAHLLLQTSTAMYAAAIGLGFLGMCLGYGFSRLFRLSGNQSRAVAFETGIQNSPLAFAIIIASFPEALHDKLLMMPMLYALFVLLSAMLFTWLTRIAATRALSRSASLPTVLF